MTSYSTFEQDQKGYTSISQTIEGEDIKGIILPGGGLAVGVTADYDPRQLILLGV
jgi:hypothetical protein